MILCSFLLWMVQLTVHVVNLWFSLILMVIENIIQIIQKHGIIKSKSLFHSSHSIGSMSLFPT